MVEQVEAGTFGGVVVVGALVVRVAVVLVAGTVVVGGPGGRRRWRGCRGGAGEERVAGEVHEALHGLRRGVGPPVTAAALVEETRPDPWHGPTRCAGVQVPAALAARVDGSSTVPVPEIISGLALAEPQE